MLTIFGDDDDYEDDGDDDYDDKDGDDDYNDKWWWNLKMIKSKDWSSCCQLTNLL